MTPYTYFASVIRTIDGDTIECLVDLGFDMHYKCKLRLLNVDAPETRTLDLEEKRRGKFVEAKLIKMLGLYDNNILIRTSKFDKYGRTLADVYSGTSYEVNVNEQVSQWTKQSLED